MPQLIRYRWSAVKNVLTNHIADVLQAEKLPILSKVGGPDEPQMRWVMDKQLEGEGLSSSVCKVAKLAAGHIGKEKKGIKRFFAVVSE